MRHRLPGLIAVVRDHLGFNVAGIHPRVFRRIFGGRASVRRCNGRCCRGGTTVSLPERDAVLSRAGIVSAAMTSRLRHRPARWFCRRESSDDDFTAGRTVETRVVDGACVFFRDDGLCALQVAGERSLRNPWALKPAVCILWPLCVQDRCVDVGYAWFTRRRECCAAVQRGEKTILQVIGSDGRMLRRMSRPDSSRGGGPPVSPSSTA